ncbi:MAG: hypothetical protein ACRC62_21235 [Microcoleus sp.]
MAQPKIQRPQSFQHPIAPIAQLARTIEISRIRHRIGKGDRTNNWQGRSRFQRHPTNPLRVQNLTVTPEYRRGLKTPRLIA